MIDQLVRVLSFLRQGKDGRGTVAPMIFLSTGCSPVLREKKGRRGQSVWSSQLIRVAISRKRAGRPNGGDGRPDGGRPVVHPSLRDGRDGRPVLRSVG